MLSKEQVNNSFERCRLIYSGIPQAINIMPMRKVCDQAILAVELQAKLDAIHKWCKNPQLSNANSSGTYFGIGYAKAQDDILTILEEK
jgi:hypothetical protein